MYAVGWPPLRAHAAARARRTTATLVVAGSAARGAADARRSRGGADETADQRSAEQGDAVRAALLALVQTVSRQVHEDTSRDAARKDEFERERLSQ